MCWWIGALSRPIALAGCEKRSFQVWAFAAKDAVQKPGSHIKQRVSKAVIAETHNGRCKN
ncbi:MAG: hypothetical protein EBZ60_10140 [Betaproteobacteria bacterium]|nr:hypothetical protein [Betaproteobacteria bacterium]